MLGKHVRQIRVRLLDIDPQSREFNYDIMPEFTVSMVVDESPCEDPLGEYIKPALEAVAHELNKRWNAKPEEDIVFQETASPGLKIVVLGAPLSQRVMLRRSLENILRTKSTDSPA